MSDNKSPLLTGDIKQISIEDEMRKSYLDYAMSVIVSRALPDVRDGLKPVHRRIIYAMNEGGYTHSKPYRKSARIVGDVMGKYHPHGDSAIYDAMVRMAQDFSMRLPLINGQGNFGSMDGDSPAAMRYTEAKMALSAHALIDDIDNDTVDFRMNYDESLQEPEVLPARYPNLLVNGASGIAVGMATNIPPFNLSELIDACVALIDNPELLPEELAQYIKGPDFPTGANIYGRSSNITALRDGFGKFVIRGETKVEEIRKGRFAIIITEIPWQINKSSLVDEIGKIKSKDEDKDKTDAISAIRDESSREGVRVVVEVKKDQDPEIVRSQLYKYTELQTSFSMNMLAINQGKPEQMGIAQVLRVFLEFREEVIRRRTLYLLGKARDKAHIMAGLATAVDNVDEVVALIRSNNDPASARVALMSKAWNVERIAKYIELLDEADRTVVNGTYYLSERQATAILELRLQRLTGLEREKIIKDLEALAAEIEGYLSLLGDKEQISNLMKKELLEVKSQFGTERRTRIHDSHPDEVEEEDLMTDDEMVVTISTNGYIKRVLASTYRVQKRGGRGRTGMEVREEDSVKQLFVINNRSSILFFSSTGIVYKLKCYKIPEGSPTSLGRALVNLLPLNKELNETITTILPVPSDLSADTSIVFATKLGSIRRNSLEDFSNVNSKGKIAMKLDEGDSLVGVLLFNSNEDIFISTRKGQALRFPLEKLRVFASRNSSGVRGIKLATGDYVINLSCVRHEKIDNIETRVAYLKYATAKRSGTPLTTLPEGITQTEVDDFEKREEFILTVTSKGYAKRTSAYEYRITGRGGSGVTNIGLTSKNGEVVESLPVLPTDEIMLVSNKGQLIRIPVANIRICSRSAQGVIAFKMENGEEVVSIGHMQSTEDDEVVILNSETSESEGTLI